MKDEKKDTKQVDLDGKEIPIKKDAEQLNLELKPAALEKLNADSILTNPANEILNVYSVVSNEDYSDIVSYAAQAPEEVRNTSWYKELMRRLFAIDPMLKRD